jgi:hypothetical protein
MSKCVRSAASCALKLWISYNLGYDIRQAGHMNASKPAVMHAHAGMHARLHGTGW